MRLGFQPSFKQLYSHKIFLHNILKIKRLVQKMWSSMPISRMLFENCLQKKYLAEPYNNPHYFCLITEQKYQGGTVFYGIKSRHRPVPPYQSTASRKRKVRLLRPLRMCLQIHYNAAFEFFRMLLMEE